MKATDSMVEKLFKRMDDWRHLPSYQLERRVDLFFSLYLPEVLSKEYSGINIRQDLIPEFPIRIGTIDKTKRENNQSKKVDYLALSADGTTAYLIELKTDNASIIDEQTETLVSACEKSFAELLEGLLKIFNSDSLNSIRRRKYLYLLNKLYHMKQIYMPAKLKKIMENETLHGITKASNDLKVTTKVEQIMPVYIVPSSSVKSYLVKKSEIKIITFADFIKVIDDMNCNDMVSTQFKTYLSDWAENEAGKPKITD